MSSGSEAVIRWRQRVKRRLVEAFGGRCGICGYDRSTSALTFHHLDPSEKEFSFAALGNTRAWHKMKAEAAKCVMLCHNCHAEVHDGAIVIPPDIRRFADLDQPPLHVAYRKVSPYRALKGADKPRLGGPCPECQAPKHVGSKYCSRECARRVARKVERPGYSALCRMVAETSRVAVAEQFGVSETAVRKWLRTGARAINRKKAMKRLASRSQDMHPS